MAKLSAHGYELYRYEGLTFRLSARSDLHILRNNGDGWKLWRKLKPGTNPEEHKQRTLAKRIQQDKTQPAFVAFKALLHSLVSLRARSWVVRAIELLPDDPDGLYTELDESSLKYTDYNPHLSLDDCVKLCQAYQLERIEAKEEKAPE